MLSEKTSGITFRPKYLIRILLPLILLMVVLLIPQARSLITQGFKGNDSNLDLSLVMNNFTEIKISDNWQFRQADSEQWLPATVPGTVHTDLLNNGLIPDPFYRTNEKLVQWVELKDWEYRTTFQVSTNTYQKQAKELFFEGLDTYAQVYLNDQPLIEVENMFVGWKVDVSELLREGDNELRILFHSPVRRGMEKLKKLDYILPAANEQAPEDERTNVFTRKAPFHYGWDWGPRLVTSGIWRPITLRAWDSGRVEDVYVVTSQADEKQATLSVEADIRAEEPGNYELVMYLNGKPHAKQEAFGLIEGINKISFEVEVESPKLWWSNGLGEAYLYRIDFLLQKDQLPLHAYSLDYGIRTLNLVQNPDSTGHSFHFELNGVPVFMKGANIIPSATLTPSVTEETYRKMINATVDANMNMLRVWGGAIYEEDLFYSLCDQKGILVWQDFMFACAMQPGDEAHLENIQLEAEYNVKRLRNHPSVALWCGDNENLIAWHNWGWKDRFSPKVSEFIWNTYQKINYQILPAAVEKYDPKNSYWASSPSSVNNQLADRKSGDEHDWTIWFGEKPFSDYWVNVPRFVSEWGMQAFPSVYTTNEFTLPEDRDFSSEVMHHRQRSKMDWVKPGFDGNDMIRRYMEKYYPVPEDFERFTYTSQLLQALGYKTAVEAHRSNMPHCMGSLYWQLNDCWPTVSWATLDYYYRPKAAHYAIKKAFSPLIVTATHDSSTVKVYTVSDKLSATESRLSIELMDFEGKVLYKENMPASVAPNTATVAYEKDLSQWVGKENYGKLMLTVKLSSEDEVLAENILFFTEPLHLELPRAEVRYEIEPFKDGYLVTLSGDKFIKDLFIDTGDKDAVLSDNYFDLLPSLEKTIEITGTSKALTLKDIKLMYLNQ